MPKTPPRKTTAKLHAPDKLFADIARYVGKSKVGGTLAYRLARYCLMDALGCAFEAFSSPECMKFLGPLIPGTIVPNGARVPGTRFELDQVKAAFDIGCLIRWLDANDTWRAGGHPSDNLGGILAVADSLSRNRLSSGKAPLTMRDVMTALIKAYEIQCILSQGNKLDRPEIGLDATFLVKVATTAVVTDLLGGTTADIVAAVSNAFVDGHSLNIYRTLANAGSRKSWAAGDSTSRAVWIASMVMRGEMGYPAALTAKTWGFYDVLYGGQPFKIPRGLGSYGIENIQFNISYPVQQHAKTSTESNRRKDSLPLLKEKFRRNLALRFPAARQRKILETFDNQRSLEVMPVPEFMEMFVI